MSTLFFTFDVPFLFQALEALWPRVSKGGVVVFDEYAIPKWSEAKAVDAFLSKLGAELEIKCLPWARTPSAYVVKNTF